jgi:superfamily II DNA/RNA helicase
MTRGYIKTLKAIQVYPCEISFTFRDSSETASLEQVLELREEAWFSRGVALADQCNQHIVAASIRACNRLRQAAGFNHQIIAVACSVEHAERLSVLYREAGMAALEIHSKQSKATQRFVLQQLRAGKIDTIIQVQMLGEGFDHPALSVAAIFRPFRSLSPYVQFVGRIMRVIRQGHPAHPDNRGYVISHVGMNTERHWEQFRELDGDDQELWAELIRGNNKQPSNSITLHEDDQVTDQEPAARIEMSVDWERVGDTAVSSYAVIDTQLPPEFPHQSHQDLHVPTVVGPQERRRQAHSRLKSEVESSIRQTLNRIRVHGLGKQVSRLHPMLRSQNNWCATRYWIYYNLNRSIGRKPKAGKDWTLEEIETALERLPAILDHFIAQYQQRYSRRSW